jgi:hypothetical protein
VDEQPQAPKAAAPSPDESPVSSWWFFAPMPIGFIAGLALDVSHQTVKYFGWALGAYVCLMVSVIKLAQWIDRRVNGSLAFKRFIQSMTLFDLKSLTFLGGLGIGAATAALFA